MRSATMVVRIPGNWIGDLATSCDLSIKVIKCVPREGTGGQSVVQIDTVDGTTGTDLVDKIRAIEPKCRVQLTSAGPGRFIGTVETNTCVVCRLVADSGCFLDSATSINDGTVQWNVLAPNAAALKSLHDKVTKLGCSVELKKVSVLRTSSELTRAQERVLQMAYNLGYFDIPKKVDLARLAKNLEISKATLDIMLRRAQRKIIANHVGGLP